MTAKYNDTAQGITVFLTTNLPFGPTARMSL